MPNVKFFFLLASLYVLVIFWKTKSWDKTVVYVYWPLAVYYVGQLYVFRVIQPEELNHPLYPDGRSLYFKFTPLIVLGVAMMVSWMYRLVKERVQSNWLIIILLMGVISRQISALNESVIPWWTQLGNTVNNLSVVLWLWWTMDYFKINKDKVRVKFWEYFMIFLKIIMIIGSLLVMVQGIKGSGLGLVVEQSGIMPYSNSGSDESWLNRPIGIWTHANVAAFAIWSFFMAWVLVKFYKEKELNLVGQRWLLLPVIALVWLQSRSVFLAIIPFLGWWVFFYKEEIILAINKVKITFWGWFGGILIMFFGAMVVVSRFWNSMTNFGSYSGWDTRSKLLEVAIRVFRHHFWWGIGDGNFIPVAFHEDMSNFMKTFPEAVHNGWMLLLTEQGMIGTIIWVIFLLVLIKKWLGFTKKDIKLRWLLLMIITSQSLVMLFQPFSSILTMGVVVGMLLLVDEGNESKKSI